MNMSKSHYFIAIKDVFDIFQTSSALFWSYKRNKIYKMDLRRICIELTQQ